MVDINRRRNYSLQERYQQRCRGKHWIVSGICVWTDEKENHYRQQQDTLHLHYFSSFCGMSKYGIKLIEGNGTKYFRRLLHYASKKAMNEKCMVRHIELLFNIWITLRIKTKSNIEDYSTLYPYCTSF